MSLASLRFVGLWLMWSVFTCLWLIEVHGTVADVVSIYLFVAHSFVGHKVIVHTGV